MICLPGRSVVPGLTNSQNSQKGLNQGANGTVDDVIFTR